MICSRSIAFTLLIVCLGCASGPVDSPREKTANGSQKIESSTGRPVETSEQEKRNDLALKKWCKELYGEMKKMYWDIHPCKSKNMKVGGYSTQGRPLVYVVFGEENATNTTLILSMVHGDEVTPLYVGVRVFQWIRNNISKYPGTRVVVAPLVNPDGFFSSRQTRTNANGVDLNRNFYTEDWHRDALRMWKHKYGSDHRRFPGNEPESEPETLFQKMLIEKYRPQKILSIHAPLNFIDYDGPSVLQLSKFPEQYVKKCLELRGLMKARSGVFYPGSLGNYTGEERGIPTLTLELPTSDARKARKYWKLFRNGIKTAITFEVRNYLSQRRTSRRR